MPARPIGRTRVSNNCPSLVPMPACRGASLTLHSKKQPCFRPVVKHYRDKTSHMREIALFACDSTRSRVRLWSVFVGRGRPPCNARRRLRADDWMGTRPRRESLISQLRARFFPEPESARPMTPLGGGLDVCPPGHFHRPPSLGGRGGVAKLIPLGRARQRGGRRRGTLVTHPPTI